MLIKSSIAKLSFIYCLLPLCSRLFFFNSICFTYNDVILKFVNQTLYEEIIIILVTSFNNEYYFLYFTFSLPINLKLLFFDYGDFSMKLV